EDEDIFELATRSRNHFFVLRRRGGVLRRAIRIGRHLDDRHGRGSLRELHHAGDRGRVRGDGRRGSSGGNSSRSGGSGGSLERLIVGAFFFLFCFLPFAAVDRENEDCGK